MAPDRRAERSGPVYDSERTADEEHEEDHGGGVGHFRAGLPLPPGTD
jgi:hypothetical protein